MGNADSITITNKNCKHMNLVKVQKNKVDNTLVLDIITAENRHHQRSPKEIPKNYYKFSFIHQLSESSEIPSETSVIHGIRFYSLIWVVLLNVVTVFSYASSE